MPTQEENDKALLDAASNGSVEEVRGFLLAGANLDASDQYGDTALHWAAANGHAAVVTALLEKGANPNAKAEHGITALHYAANNGHAAVVTVLVEKGADLKAKNNDGNTALHWAADKGHAAVVTALLEAGADPNATNDRGYTALIRAVSFGHAAVVTALVEAGADLNASTQYGHTALHWAADYGHAGIVVKIKKHIESGEYEWRQHLPRLRQAAWNYYNPVKTSITEGLSPEPELAETASIESFANRVIPVFLHLISQPLAFAKLLHERLIDPEIMANFAKIMAALDALEKYDGGRPVVAKAIEDGILELTKLGEIFSSEGAIVGIDDVIKTLSDDNYAEVFETTWRNKSLTTLQKVISDVSIMFGGKSYPDPVSFVELKKELDPKREEGVRIWKEMEIKIRKKTNHPSIQFGLTCSLFYNPGDNEIYNLDGEAATPELEFRAATEPEPEPEATPGP